MTRLDRHARNSTQTDAIPFGACEMYTAKNRRSRHQELRALDTNADEEQENGHDVVHRYMYTNHELRWPRVSSSHPEVTMYGSPLPTGR